MNYILILKIIKLKMLDIGYVIFQWELWFEPHYNWVNGLECNCCFIDFKFWICLSSVFFFLIFSIEDTHCILVGSFKNVINENNILIVSQVWLLWFQSLNNPLKCLTVLGLNFLFTGCLLSPKLNFTKKYYSHCNITVQGET